MLAAYGGGARTEGFVCELETNGGTYGAAWHVMSVLTIVTFIYLFWNKLGRNEMSKIYVVFWPSSNAVVI